MPRRRDVLVLVASCALAPTALAQQLRLPKVEVHAAEDVDFSAIKTYGWKDPVSKAQKKETHTSIVWYTERGLEQKGLTRIPEGSDAETEGWSNLELVVLDQGKAIDTREKGRVVRTLHLCSDPEDLVPPIDLLVQNRRLTVALDARPVQAHLVTARGSPEGLDVALRRRAGDVQVLLRS